MSIRPQGFQTPSPLARRGPSMSDESMFLLDSDINMSIPHGSMMSDCNETQFYFGSFVSIGEDTFFMANPQEYNTPQQQMSFNQSARFAPPNTMPVKNCPSLLSQHLKAHGNVQAYGNPIATSPVNNHPSFPHGADHVTFSPMHRFMGPSLKTNEEDRYTPHKFDYNADLQILSPDPGFSSPTADWLFDQNMGESKPIGIESLTKALHGHGDSLSNPGCPQHHPYRSPGYGDAPETIYSPDSLFIDLVTKQFTPHQQQAALKIMNYQQAHPNTAIPASFITADLAEVQDGRGWCLLGSCGVDRAKEKLKPQYDPSKDATRKRLDHLYDHIRDKHFNRRPFRCSMYPCTQTFSREHDLKRHEKTHTTISLPRDVCGKHYTREDNLKRHVQLKHLSPPQTSRGPASMSFPY